MGVNLTSELYARIGSTKAQNSKQAIRCQTDVLGVVELGDGGRGNGKYTHR